MSNTAKHELAVGVIGLGRIATARHLKNLPSIQGVRLQAVCDIDGERANKVATEHGAAPYTDFEQMFAAEQLDAVLICTPPVVRLEPIRAAAQRGVAVFVEKPPAAEYARGLEIARIVEEHNIINAVGFMYRFSRAVDHLKALLGENPINIIRSVFVCGPALDPEQPKWFFKKEISGGPMLDQAIHVLDLTRYIAGDTVAVQAFGANVVCPKTDEFTVEDSLSVNLRYASGAIHNHAHSWAYPGGRLGIELISDRMDVRLTPTSLKGRIGGEEIDVTPAENDFYLRELQTFFQAVRTQDQNLIRSPYSDAVKTLATVLAANESVESETLIRLTNAPWNGAATA